MKYLSIIIGVALGVAIAILIIVGSKDLLIQDLKRCEAKLEEITQDYTRLNDQLYQRVVELGGVR